MNDENSRALSSSPLPRRLQGIGQALIQAGQSARPRRPELEQAGREFLRTGQLKMRGLQAGVMERPRFMGSSVQSLKRGEWVTVLDTHGSWYKVRTEQGREGFVHSSRFVPRTVTLRPGSARGGSARGESEHGGRG